MSKKRLAKFEIYPDNQGEQRWRLRAPNGHIIADSGEGYKTLAAVMKSIENVIEYSQHAQIEKQSEVVTNG